MAQENKSKQPELVLYDLGCNKIPNKCWSLNIWKTRLCLAYKGLDYTTKFVQFPEVKPTLTSLAIPVANPALSDAKTHTVPTVTFGTETSLMDSLAIAYELEKRFPEPSLHMDSPYQDRLSAMLAKTSCIGPELVLKIPEVLLAGDVYDWYIADRTRDGGDLSKLREEKGGEQAWKGMEPAIKEMAAMWKENEGPFVMGEEPSWTDFRLVGFLKMFKTLDQGYYDRIVAVDPVLDVMFKASEKWMVRDDY